MIKTGIYKIINKISKKFYIGSTSSKGGFAERWRIHIRDLKQNKHHSKHLQRAWNKYGNENFQFEIIIYCDPEKCIFFEQKCLDVYKPWLKENGYNENKNANSMLGFKHSDETKNLISQKQIGRKISDQTRLKISNSMKNKIRSKEHCNNLSKSLKNTFKDGMTEAHKKNMRKPKTDEHIEKIQKGVQRFWDSRYND